MLKNKWFATVLILAFTAFSIYLFVSKQFSIEHIKAEWEIEDIAYDEFDNKTLELRLSQSFSYLDRGKQSYVFASEDGLYVLKFFDTRRLAGKDPVFSLKPESAERKKEQLLEGYKLAYSKDRDHAALIYVQLMPQAGMNINVTLKDRFGIKHVVDLGSVPFILQYKAVPTRKVVSNLLSKGEVTQVKSYLRLLVDMYLDEYSRGLHDNDHNFMYNTGFIGTTPVRIDVGRLSADQQFKDPKIYAADLRKVFQDRLGEWLQRHFPQYRKELLEDMKDKLDRVP